MKHSRPLDVLYALLWFSLGVQSAAAFEYHWTHPELTSMQVLQAAGQWLLPLRWLP